MTTQRIDRINELIRREVASQIYRVMTVPGFDLTAVTVTRVIASPDLRQARILVSIRGTPERQQWMMGQLARHRGEMQALVAKHVVLKYTPHILFALDESIAEGDHVLGLIARMEEEHPDWTAPPEPASDAPPGPPPEPSPEPPPDDAEPVSP